MIANRTLDIKAVKPAKNKRGIVHYKLGVFTDTTGDYIVFNGSVNFSQYALQNNVEALSCDCSWEAVGNTKKRITMLTDVFENAWQGKSDAMVFIPIEEVKTAIKQAFPVKKMDDLINVEKELIRELLADPETSPSVKEKLLILSERLKLAPSKKVISPKKESTIIKLRPYQQEAIRNWKKNGYKGMLEMATGTGKTFTALAAIQQLLAEKKRLQIIISCPFIHLAEQWVDEAAKFGFTNAILIGDSRTLWEDNATYQAQLFKRNKVGHIIFITTNNSFRSSHFQKIIEQSFLKTLLIIDEAHYAGAYSLRQALSETIPYRLGLSATPERYGDDEGTQFLKHYFDKVVFSLPLEKAIGEYLCEYSYYPEPVELNESEFDEYVKLTKIIGRLMGSDKDENIEKAHKASIKRARILNNAEGKLDWLKNNMNGKSLEYSIFYCGTQIFKPVKEILSHQYQVRLHEFTAKQTRKERKKLLQRFEEGELQALVAMKCLDEGVDVPPTRTAYFFASSANPREFIQRRGRILRKCEGKEEAVIYDLIAVPPVKYINEGRKGEKYQAVKSAFKREYMRVREFSELAKNKYTSLEKMFDIANKLELTDL